MESSNFSDEKLFTLNGCDSYYCWLYEKHHPQRLRKVLRAPGVMVWAMIQPNRLLSYEILKETKFFKIYRNN